MPEGDTIYGAAQRIRAALVGKAISGIDRRTTYWCPSCQA